MRAKYSILVAVAILLVAGGWLRDTLSDPGPNMTTAAEAFLAALTPEQKSTAVIAFDDTARLDWHFIPKPQRKGLQIKQMDDAQRKAAHKLLESGLSHLGYDKATTIMGLEAILRELEKARTDAPIRDPERYYFTVFGAPSATSRWGWSVEGHHLSLNFVVDHGQVAATTPTFFGANPAEVRADFGNYKKGLRILKPEEDTGFKLLASLTPEQRKKAVIAEKAPNDLRGAAQPKAPSEPIGGLSVSEMTPEQHELLRSLLKAYTDNMPAAVAKGRLDALTAAGLDKIHFAWAGVDRPGIGHYYVVEGPTFVIEFVNTQPDSAGNPANHIHSLWRDVNNDFGQGG